MATALLKLQSLMLYVIVCVLKHFILILFCVSCFLIVCSFWWVDSLSAFSEDFLNNIGLQCKKQSGLQMVIICTSTPYIQLETCFYLIIYICVYLCLNALNIADNSHHVDTCWTIIWNTFLWQLEFAFRHFVSVEATYIHTSYWNFLFVYYKARYLWNRWNVIIQVYGTEITHNQYWWYSIEL